MRKRKKERSLTDTRIYKKYNTYYYFSPTPLVNPLTGAKVKWHKLCDIAEGERKARQMRDEILAHNTQNSGDGDMPRHLTEYMSLELKKREKSRPDDEMKLKMFIKRNKDLMILNDVIASAFAEFNVADVLPVDIAQFIDQWDGRRMAQVYKSHLVKFFEFACRKGLRNDNPAREIKTETPEKRNVYITHEQFHAIRDALMSDEKGAIPSGGMIQCYVDLCYLLYQRTTEIRLLKFSDIKPEGIYFKPTKTEKSSGKDVIIPMTAEIEAVIERAKAAQKVQSTYVICTQTGQPYSASGLRSAWKRACERVGISGLNLKDIRSKAATDAALSGSSLEELATGMAHTDTATTKGYVRFRETPVSSVNISLPPKSNKKPSNTK